MQKPTVLVAEDSKTVSHGIEEILIKHGYPRSEIITTAADAVVSARAKHPDIVLMDIGLNGSMNGMEAAEIISRECGIPVIFLTAATDVAMLEGALKSECSTYLIKPVQEAELIINIEIVVQKNRIAKSFEEERRWREAILDGVIDAVLATDETGGIVYMNTPASVLLEADDDFVGKKIQAYAQFADMEGNTLTDLIAADQRIECQMLTSTGQNHIVLMKTQTLFNPVLGVPVNVITLNDITEEWILQEKIRFMTFHDSLTGLYNRSFLEEELIRLNTERQLPISIIMADLNGLKITNDVLGHMHGDLLLKSCATQLNEACRDEDIIARFGGDEFLVFLPSTTEADVRCIVERIRSGSENIITPLGPMSIALGHYTKENLEETMQSAIMRADEDMYHDKASIKRNYSQHCFNYVYDELQKHPYEGHRFTNLVIRLMEQLIELKGDISKSARDIRHLGRVYDIGMICLPTRIYKYSRFKIGDWDQIHKHSEMSYKIVNMSPKYSNVAEAVLYHHERWDGKGYPYRLKGTEIPLMARMLAVVDAYCSMISLRHYREPMMPQEALMEILKGAGNQFDPEIVALFAKMMENIKE